MISWTVWAIRLVLTLFGAGGMAFGVANYITNVSRDGLTTSIETLRTTVSDLSATVTATNNNVAALNQTVTSVNSNLASQLIDLERERARLAVEIAKEVQKLQGEQGGQARDILYLRESIDRIEKSIIEIAANTTVRYTVDGGKTFESIEPEEALVKFGIPQEGQSYVIAPWSYNRYDPKTGVIDPTGQ